MEAIMLMLMIMVDDDVNDNGNDDYSVIVNVIIQSFLSFLRVFSHVGHTPSP